MSGSAGIVLVVFLVLNVPMAHLPSLQPHGPLPPKGYDKFPRSAYGKGSPKPPKRTYALDIHATTTPGNYPPGLNMYGIRWNPRYFADLRVTLENHSDIDYSDVDVTLNLDDASDFAGWGQVTSIANVSFMREDKVFEGAQVKLPSGTVVPVSESAVQFLRFVCPVLPEHSHIELIFAVVGVPDVDILEEGTPGEQRELYNEEKRNGIFSKGNPLFCHLQGKFTAGKTTEKINGTVRLR